MRAIFGVYTSPTGPDCALRLHQRDGRALVVDGEHRDIYLRDYGDLPEASGAWEVVSNSTMGNGHIRDLIIGHLGRLVIGTPRTSREGTGMGASAPDPFQFKMGEETTVKLLV